MSVIDEPQVDEAESSWEPDAAYHRRLRRRRQVLVSPVLLVVLVLLLPALWAGVQGLLRVTEPEAFAKYAGTGVIGMTKEQAPGTRVAFGITNRLGPLPDVTMRGARVDLSDGSVATAAAVSICRHEPTQTESGGIGLWSGDLSEFCAAIVPVEGQDLGELDEGDSLIITVVPLEEGPVHVTGVDFDYVQGDRRATEHVAYDFRVGMPS